jgi:CBS domain-containing protein
MGTTVADVMTTRVIAVKRSADYKEICGVLRRYRVSACPVINDAGKVVGVVSEADLLVKVADPNPPPGLIRLRWKLSEESKVNAVTAEQLMTTPAISIQPDAPVAVAARIMQDRRVRRLPVVGPGGMLVGIVSRTDLLSVFERPDLHIRDEVVRDVIAGEFGLNADDFDVSVVSGIVTVGGPVARLETALSLLARVRHAEGVVAVRDRLIVAESSGQLLGVLPATDASCQRVRRRVAQAGLAGDADPAAGDLRWR